MFLISKHFIQTFFNYKPFAYGAFAFGREPTFVVCLVRLAGYIGG